MPSAAQLERLLQKYVAREEDTFRGRRGRRFRHFLECHVRRAAPAVRPISSLKAETLPGLAVQARACSARGIEFWYSEGDESPDALTFIESTCAFLDVTPLHTECYGAATERPRAKGPLRVWGGPLFVSPIMHSPRDLSTTRSDPGKPRIGRFLLAKRRFGRGQLMGKRGYPGRLTTLEPRPHVRSS